MKGPAHGSVWLAIIALPAMVACSLQTDDADTGILAWVDDEPVRLAEFERYLEDNLAFASGDLDPQQGELDRVRSRMLDALIDERVLLLEAQRRGIDVDKSEIDDYVRELRQVEAERPADRDGRRDEVRRRLRIQKVQESILRSFQPTAPDEARAYLDQHPELVASGPRIRARTLMLDSLEQAERAHTDLKKRRITFDEAVVAYEQGPGAGEAVELDLEGLPDEVRGALKELRPGRVSPPLALNGNFYIFRVESRLDRKTAETELDDATLQLLDAMRRREAYDAHVAELRERTEIRIGFDRLPFSYIPLDKP